VEVPSGQTGEDGRDLLVALRAGTKLRGYEIVSVLGEGSFGITYLARDATLGREVAIKEYLPSTLAVRRGDSTVVPRSTAASDDFNWGRDRFLEEARTLVKLEGVPGVVRVIDYLEANGTAYMVMALARGETLLQRIRAAGPLSPPQIERILWPLLDGLEQVHAAGYLHRDIKPSNIILDARGAPTLIDFGASRAAMLDRTSADMTAIFSPGYAAAEQFVSMKQGPWTDIYGLSATLYHAVAGTQPPSAIERTLEDAYKPLVQLAPAGFDPGILGGIDAGMAVRAADRPQSIAAWRQLLQQKHAAVGDTVFVRRSQAEAPTLPIPPSPARRSWTKRPAVWLGLAAAIVVLAGGGYFVNAAIEEQRSTAAAVVAAKKQADEATAKLKAEAEARLKADEARRQQAAAAAQKAQEERARKDREAAEAASRRQADEERARKRAQFDEEARAQAERAGAPFDGALRDWMAQYSVKQASLAVLREDRLIYARGYNGRGVDDRIPVWGLSRAITAVCVATLIGEGKLRLDDKLGRWLQPVYVRAGRPADPRFDDITIEDLLTQRSGLPERFGDNGLAPGAWQILQRMPVRSATAEMLMPGIISRQLTSPPGERHALSIPNYLLLGQVVEAVTGESYADGCARRVLAKAGISRPQLDPVWGRLLQGWGGWSLSGPEYLAFLRLYRPRQPDLLAPEMRRWLWEGDKKWTDARREVAYSLGVWTRPTERNLWSVGNLVWEQTDAHGGPIAVKQGTTAALANDGTGWFASFDTVNPTDQKAIQALERALWAARKEVKSWPGTDLFGERGIRPVSVER
jgi:serine/threonine protein kinase/CubicO group peptidase (beta-lactamase class C family)